MFAVGMDILVDSLYETLSLFPYLYLTYLALEYLEHKTSYKTLEYIKKSNKYGPIIGGILGLVPQCGFSVAASNLYVTGVISLGALIAIFLSTSDEMLPILISGGANINTIIMILLLKIIFAVSVGILVEKFLPQKFIMHKKEPEIEAFCQRENCKCEDKDSMWHSAFRHTEKISIYIFIFSIMVNTAFTFGGRETFSNILEGYPLISKFVASAIGLIPNCYPSVLLTQLYLDNSITIGTMMAGTLSNAGLGILVLYRINPNRQETLRIIGLMYILGVILGLVSEILL